MTLNICPERAALVMSESPCDKRITHVSQHRLKYCIHGQLKKEIQSKYNYCVARKAIELHDDRKRDDKVQQRLMRL